MPDLIQSQDQIQDQDQDQDQPYQLTPGDLSELHGIARQLKDVGDPRAARIWNLLNSQSGDGSVGPNVTIRQSPVQATSWQDDLENEIGGSEAAGGSKPDTADFLDNLSGIGRRAYFAMRDPDPPAYKGWRGQNFVRNNSGSYVSSDGEAYSNDELKQIHGVLSRQAGNPLVSGVFGPIPPVADYLVWRNQNYNNDHEVGGAWEDDDGGLYSQEALHEAFAAKAAAQSEQAGQPDRADDAEAENRDKEGDAQPQETAAPVETQESTDQQPKLLAQANQKSAKQTTQTPAQQKPTQDEVVAYIRQQADAYKMPQALALGLVNKESHFDPSQKGADGEVGLCQILPLRKNEKHLDANGKEFRISLPQATTDWKYNVRAGLSLLKEAYTFAQKNQPDDVIAATYARYNGQSNWKYYPRLNSNVHEHVYGKDVVRKGQTAHEDGYIDFYHQWGGK